MGWFSTRHHERVIREVETRSDERDAIDSLPTATIRFTQVICSWYQIALPTLGANSAAQLLGRKSPVEHGARPSFQRETQVVVERAGRINHQLTTARGIVSAIEFLEVRSEI